MPKKGTSSLRFGSMRTSLAGHSQGTSYGDAIQCNNFSYLINKASNASKQEKEDADYFYSYLNM